MFREHTGKAACASGLVWDIHIPQDQERGACGPQWEEGFLHPDGWRSRPDKASEGNQGGCWPDRASDSRAVEEEGERMSQAQLAACRAGAWLWRRTNVLQ